MLNPRPSNQRLPHHFAIDNHLGSARLMFGPPEHSALRRLADDAPSVWNVAVAGFAGLPYLDALWHAFVEHLVGEFLPHSEPVESVAVIMGRRAALTPTVVAIPAREPIAVRLSTRRRVEIDAGLPSEWGRVAVWRDRGLQVTFELR